MDAALHPLPAEVRRAEIGRREQDLRTAVDGDAELLFGPRMAAVVTAEARFDMGHRHLGQFGSERCTQGARCVALHDDQLRRGLRQHGRHRPGHPRNVGVRVLLARAAEMDRRIKIQPVIGGVQARMLAGEDQLQRDSATLEGGSNGRKLDRLGTSPDCDDDSVRQPSP